MIGGPTPGMSPATARWLCTRGSPVATASLCPAFSIDGEHPKRSGLSAGLKVLTSRPIPRARHRSLNYPESQELRGDQAMKIQGLPAGFIFPAQPVLRLKPTAGTDWVHEIKHDGHRMIVRRDGPTMRLYSRNAYDWTCDWRQSRLLPRRSQVLHDRRRGGYAGT